VGPGPAPGPDGRARTCGRDPRLRIPPPVPILLPTAHHRPTAPGFHGNDRCPRGRNVPGHPHAPLPHRPRLHRRDRLPGPGQPDRLLGVPLSVPTPFRRERSGHTSGRHRRTARLWGAWLRKAGYEVLTAWSEVSLPGRKRTTADALAWGRYNNQPVLFWLEVEAGTSSGQRIRRRIQRRLAVAEDWAQEQGLPLIFTVLGRPWAVRAAAQGLRPRQAAVLLAAWTAFGQLPRPDFSGIQEHHSLRTRR